MHYLFVVVVKVSFPVNFFDHAKILLNYDGRAFQVSSLGGFSIKCKEIKGRVQKLN